MCTIETYMKDGRTIYLTTPSTYFIYGYMVKYHSDTIIFTIPLIVHTTDILTPVVKHWLEREVAKWALRHKNASSGFNN